MTDIETDEDDSNNDRPASWLSVHQALRFVAKFLRGAIIPKLLTPTYYGLYTTLTLSLQYGKLADFGVLRLAGKRLPAILSAGGEEEFRTALARCLTWILTVMGIVSLALVIFSTFVESEHAWFYRIAFPIAGTILVARQVRILMSHSVRARENYRDLAFIGIAVVGVGLVASLTLLYVFGIFGLISGLLVTELTVLVYAATIEPIPWPVRISFEQVVEMITGGVQLQFLAMSNTLLRTVDKLFIVSFFSKRVFGFYSLGFFVATTANTFSGILKTVIQPKLMRIFDEDSSEAPEKGVDLLDRALLSYYSILLVGFPIGYLLLYAVIRWYLPEYAEPLPAYFLISLFALVGGTSNLVEPIFVARDLELRLFGYYIGTAALGAAANGVVIGLGGGLEGVILATVSSYAGLNAVCFWEIGRATESSQDGLKFLFYVIIVVVVAVFWVYLRNMGVTGPILDGISQLAVVSALTLAGVFLLGVVFRKSVYEAVRTFW